MNGQQQQLTIQLPLPDADFAKEYASRHRISISELFDGLLRNLKEEAEQDPIGPRIRAMIGILPSDFDVDAAKDEYITQKYLNDKGHDRS